MKRWSRLPDRITLNFYDSFAMSQFREQQQAMAASQQNSDGARDEAMTQAAAESGVGKRELIEFAQQLSQQNSAAIRQLQTDHAATAAAEYTA